MQWVFATIGLDLRSVAYCPFRLRLVCTWIPSSCPKILEMRLSFCSFGAPAILNAHNLCKVWSRKVGF